MQLEDKVLETYVEYGDVSTVVALLKVSKTYVESIISRFKHPNSGCEVLEYFAEFVEDS